MTFPNHDSGVLSLQEARRTHSTVEEALAAVGRGDMVVVVDDEHRENEGDLVMAAQFTTPEKIAFFVRHTSGLICVPMLGSRLDELGLPLMVSANSEGQQTAFTVSVDARDGTTTGISAADRARTIRVLNDPGSGPGDLLRPGHVFPLRYRDGGVLQRAGHTEAAVDLARLAGLEPAGVICELVSEDRKAMARSHDLAGFADRHGLPFVSVADLVDYRLRREQLVEPQSNARIPTDHGELVCYAYRSALDGLDHLALVMGTVSGRSQVPVSLHRECLIGDVFHSGACPCRGRLDLALEQLATAGHGVIVYLRSEVSARSSGEEDAVIAAQILLDLAVRSARPLSTSRPLDAVLEIFGLQPEANG